MRYYTGGPPNFIEMIDNLLDKVDPAQFVVMIEKLSAALPPPGQAVLNPFLVVLKQVRHAYCHFSPVRMIRVLFRKQMITIQKAKVAK